MPRLASCTSLTLPFGRVRTALPLLVTCSLLPLGAGPLLIAEWLVDALVACAPPPVPPPGLTCAPAPPPAVVVCPAAPPVVVVVCVAPPVVVVVVCAPPPAVVVVVCVPVP